ncbi:MAG: radical SAM protein [Lachnospiraceae bacterium]|nr:radical SAM protein [Lachnospiraceae bacterium]
MHSTSHLLSNCILCPRKCGSNRLAGQVGYCGMPADLVVARAALHMWEEPCISGTTGSGTVFFGGCNLKCVFCQNHSIAIGDCGKKIRIARLAEIFLELQEKGAANINLVTPTHYIPQIREALLLAKENGLTLPIVYNTGSYENADILHLLDGLIDIYLPDLKYFSAELSLKYSHAADYFEQATLAIAEMYRQVGTPVFDEATGMMKKGMIVRHLLLPGQAKDSKKILRYLHETYGDNIYISIMNQYTPLPHVAHIPELNRKVLGEEYDRVVNFALRLGIENAFIQEGETAEESFIPPFDMEGV